MKKKKKTRGTPMHLRPHCTASLQLYCCLILGTAPIESKVQPAAKTRLLHSIAQFAHTRDLLAVNRSHHIALSQTRLGCRCVREHPGQKGPPVDCQLQTGLFTQAGGERGG